MTTLGCCLPVQVGSGVEGASVGFQATVELLRQAAGKVNGRADAVGAANLAGPAERVAESMPGGTAAGQARELAEAWRTTLSAWAAGAHEYAKDLADSADTYHDVEQTNEAGLNSRAPRGVS